MDLRGVRLSTAALTAALTAGCSTVVLTPVAQYENADARFMSWLEPDAPGYRTEQIDALRFKITATGTNVTAAKRVDAIALRRAAEIAAQNNAPRLGILSKDRRTICRMISTPIYSPEGRYVTAVTTYETLPRTLLTVRLLHEGFAMAAYSERRFNQILSVDEARSGALAELAKPQHTTAEKSAALETNRERCRAQKAQQAGS